MTNPIRYLWRKLRPEKKGPEMAAHYYTKMTMMELECISEMMTLIESRLETWLELPVDVECRFFDEHEEDNYVEGRLRIDGNEIYRVVEAHPLDAMDLISSWAIRNLILNCGNSSNRLHPPLIGEA